MRSKPPVVMSLMTDPVDDLGVRLLLSLYGVSARSASRGGEAVLAAIQGEVDAIILDGDQSDMTAAEIVGEIRRWDSTTALVFFSEAGALDEDAIEQNWRTRIVPRANAPIAEAKLLLDCVKASSPRLTRWMETRRRSNLMLIAQDEGPIAHYAETYFKQRGFEVHVVDLGEDAVEFARTYRYSVMLIDDGLPDMSGYAAIREIRARDGATPIVLLSGAGQAVMDAALAAGADEVIELPCNWNTSADRVRALMSSGRKEAA